MKIKNILVIIVLFAALVGAGFLVKNSQETRSGASFASVEALFLPSARTVSVGDKFTTNLMIDSKSHLLTGVDIRVKFDSEKLSLEKVAVRTKENIFEVNNEKSWLQNADGVLISEINAEKGTYNLVATNIEKETKNLPNGVIGIVDLYFTAKANGEARVSLDNGYENRVAGYNPAGSDQELKIEKISEAIYTIKVKEVGVTGRPIVTGAALKCGWCGKSCVNLSEKTGGCVMADIVPQGQCVSRDGKCVVVSRYVSPTIRYVTPTQTIYRRVTPGVSIKVTPKTEIPIVTMDPQPEVY